MGLFSWLIKMFDIWQETAPCLPDLFSCAALWTFHGFSLRDWCCQIFHQTLRFLILCSSEACRLHAPLPSVSSLIIMLSLRNRATTSTLRACLLFNCKLRSLFWIYSAFLNFLVKPGQSSVYIQLQKLSLSPFLILGSVWCHRDG